MSKVLKMRRPQLECQACGATADASCDCGAPYLPAGQRAVAAIKANPGKSDRAIAAQIGVSPTTVGKARQLSIVDSSRKRLGKDGKVRRLPTRQAPARNENLLLPEFEKVITQLERLCSKSLGVFADTMRAPSDLENLAEKVSAWLRGVAKAKQAAAKDAA
jgi:hypothetical protein